MHQNQCGATKWVQAGVGEKGEHKWDLKVVIIVYL